MTFSSSCAHFIEATQPQAYSAPSRLIRSRFRQIPDAFLCSMTIVPPICRHIFGRAGQRTLAAAIRPAPATACVGFAYRLPPMPSTARDELDMEIRFSMILRLSKPFLCRSPLLATAEYWSPYFSYLAIIKALPFVNTEAAIDAIWR